MKFREVVEVNRSPKIEGVLKIHDGLLFVYTSDSIYGIDLMNNTIEEVEFTKND